MDLSIIIPARNEMWLKHTVDDLLKNIEGSTEIIVVLDGQWADPGIPQNDRVNVVYLPEAIGQRAACNLAVKLSKAKYICKVDAHCAFDKGFDVKMMKLMEDDITMIPVMRNLHVFDWKCYHCGWKKYQGPTPEKCENCGKSDKIRRKVVWIAKTNPQSTAYYFDPEPHFQYFSEYKKRPVYQEQLKTGLTETMSIQGSCWMVTRDKYWELNLGDENFGSWGSQGIQVACSTWLSGGRVMVNHTTWYAHLFRTQGLDFGFPYSISGRQVDTAKKRARELFYKNKWPKQIHPSSWLIDKFWPVPRWSDADRLKLITASTDFENKLHRVFGVVSTVPSTVANHTPPMTSDRVGQEMSVPTMGSFELTSGSPITDENIIPVGEKSEMGRVTATPIITDMVKNGGILALASGDGSNHPSIHKSVDTVKDFVNTNFAIPIIEVASPIPTPAIFINDNLLKDTVDRCNGDILNDKHIIDVHNTSISKTTEIVNNKFSPPTWETFKAGE